MHAQNWDTVGLFQLYKLFAALLSWHLALALLLADNCSKVLIQAEARNPSSVLNVHQRRFGVPPTAAGHRPGSQTLPTNSRRKSGEECVWNPVNPSLREAAAEVRILTSLSQTQRDRHNARQRKCWQGRLCYLVQLWRKCCASSCATATPSSRCASCSFRVSLASGSRSFHCVILLTSPWI